MTQSGRSLFPIISFLAIQMVGCGFIEGTSQQSVVQNTENPKNPLIDIDIPKDQTTPEQLQRVGLGLRKALKEGTEQVPLKHIVDMLELQGPVLDVIPGILESHPGPITVTCRGLICNGTSSGKAHSFVADFINIPIFGTPTVYLEPSITMELTLSADGQSLEICKITGIHAKASNLGGNIDGFIFKIKDQEIETLKIDVGFGGRYPNDRCKIKKS
jgi:hypothetical protein